ncbi:hypothetical protein KY285_020317 [Solanum tuberosum]|nr:hypothetical protein KY285_020317 [Solanum tuberosum]
MVENGIMSGKIVSQDALKAITQTQKIDPRDPVYQYEPPQFHHYLPMQDTKYSIVPPQYAVYGAQPYAYPPNYPQWRAPTHKNVRYSSQKFQAPYNLHHRDLKEFKDLLNNFTPIGEFYTSLFEKLKRLNMIEPTPQNYVDPNAKSFNPTIRCAYHSDAPGHSIEDCQNIR